MGVDFSLCISRQLVRAEGYLRVLGTNPFFTAGGVVGVAGSDLALWSSATTVATPTVVRGPIRPSNRLL